jgi:hypothetical protein
MSPSGDTSHRRRTAVIAAVLASMTLGGCASTMSRHDAGASHLASSPAVSSQMVSTQAASSAPAGGTTPAASPSFVATWSVPPATPMLPSVDCPTAYGTTNPGSPHPVTLLPTPPDVTGSFASYTDALHNIAVLGPTGWSCHAIDAADGNVSIMVTPPGVPSEPIAQPFIRDTREGIHAFVASAGTGSVLDLICPVMPDLLDATSSGRPCWERPATETVNRDNPVAAEFYDPPGVVGDGAPSGGNFQAVGRMLDDPAHGDQPEGAASVTCTLPPQPVGLLCDDVVVEFAPFGPFYPIPGG